MVARGRSMAAFGRSMGPPGPSMGTLYTLYASMGALEPSMYEKHYKKALKCTKHHVNGRPWAIEPDLAMGTDSISNTALAIDIFFQKLCSCCTLYVSAFNKKSKRAQVPPEDPLNAPQGSLDPPGPPNDLARPCMTKNIIPRIPKRPNKTTPDETI